MNATDKLDATATETLLRFLAERFGERRPRLTISNRQRNHGSYHPRQNRIVVSRNAEAWVMLHEFAHYLDKLINGAIHKQRLYGFASTPHSIFRMPNTRDIWHGDSFYHNLRRVVEAAGCNDYPWTKEYKQIARWARRDGLTAAGKVTP